MLIPESVRAYVHDGAIRRPINEILALDERTILDGIGWDELDRFYRAKLAARQLQCEWGCFAIEAWNAI